ncbi:MAG TPA: ABC transporter substrate-binding protein [Sulfurimonas sp.]
MKLLILLASIIFFMTGCESRLENRALKIGTNIWPGYEALHLAKEEKFFTQNIKTHTYESATIVLDKFRKKEIDAAALTLDEVILLKDQGYSPTIVAVLDISNGADVVIAQNSIKSIQELKGKSIGVENSALGSYMLARILEKANLEYKDIILVPIGLERHEDAFKENIVDAVITFDPVRSRLLQAGGVEIFSSKDIPGEIVDVLVVQKKLADSKVIKSILEGWSKSVSIINKRDERAIRIVSKRLNQTPKEFIASLEGLKIPSLEESDNLMKDGRLENTITKIGEIMYEKRFIRSKINPGDIIKSN